MMKVAALIAVMALSVSAGSENGATFDDAIAGKAVSSPPPFQQPLANLNHPCKVVAGSDTSRGVDYLFS
jgi:hypothetical protein